MKRFVKFGAILMVLAVAFVGCKHKVNGVKEEVKTTVTVRVVENLNLKHEFTLPIGDVATVKAGINAELDKVETPGSAGTMTGFRDLTFNGTPGYIYQLGTYHTVGKRLLTDDELLEVIKKGGIIILEVDKL